MQITSALRKRIARTKGVMFDIDGCLILSDGPGGYQGRVLPGAIEAVKAVKDAGLKIVIFTNGSMQSPQELANSIRELGFDVEDHEVFTPGRVASTVIKQRYGDAPILAFGGDGVQRPMQDQGVNVLDPADYYTTGLDQHIAAVVIGWDTEFGHKKIQLAAEALQDGAKLYCTSVATHFAAEHRMNVGVSGFITMGLAHVAGVDFELVGKPSASAIDAISLAMSVEPHELMIIGDDLVAEVGMAVAAGGVGILTTTGVSTRAAAETADSATSPDLIVDSMSEFVDIFSEYFPLGQKIT